MSDDDTITDKNNTSDWLLREALFAETERLREAFCLVGASQILLHFPRKPNLEAYLIK